MEGPIDINQLEHIPLQDPEDDLPVQTAALSHFLVLKNIFSFLNPHDLKNCWSVSRPWKEAAETFVFVHYDIEINILNDGSTTGIILTERGLFNRGNLKRYELDFQEATNKLEQTLLTHKQKVGLSLSISGLDCFRRNSSAGNFVSQFGPLVQHLRFSATLPMNLNMCRKFLLTHFPNLQTLGCPALWLKEDSRDFEDFYTDLPENQLKNLKKIDLGWDVKCDVGTLGKFLKIAPNLEEMEKLPIWLIDAVVAVDKVPALKSVLYHFHEEYYQNGISVLSAFQRLEQLKPKLSSFSLNLETFFRNGDSIIKVVKPLIFSILQSSADSLRIFETTPSEIHGYQEIPPLKGVKTLVFQNSDLKYENGRFLSPERSLEEIFPNVSEIRLWFDMWEKTVNQYLPEIMGSSWGSQIKLLNLRHLPSGSLGIAKSLFPNIEGLEFNSSINGIAKHLREIPQFWPELKSMAINVNSCVNYRHFHKPGPELLDFPFTGLPPNVVTQLLDPLKRENFSDDTIKDFKTLSPLFNFEDLQQLMLTLNKRHTHVEYNAIYTRLTPVGYEFGFRLFPHLKVSVANFRILK